jgi:tRNA-uridine 2-sulfurtransferase
VPGRLGWQGNIPVIWFDEPEEGVARGQAAVLYDPAGGTRILGGGFILRAIPADERVVAA